MSLVGAWHVMLIATTNPDKTLYRETAKYRTWPTCCDIAKRKWKIMVLGYQKEPYMMLITLLKACTSLFV